MSLQLNGTAGVTYNDGSNQPAAASPYVLKNLIINGDMRIAQRGTSVTGVTANGYYAVDRMLSSINSAGTWTISQDTDVPSGQGFSYSYKYDCTTANASLSSGSYLMMEQRFEGQNLQHLKKGTSSAESITLSFWVKSNKTGTYVVLFLDSDNSRSISKSYSIDSANTWEKKTITVAGDTVGAFNNDNSRSLDVKFIHSAGTDWTSGTLNTSWNSDVLANRAAGLTVNLADSTSNYINITGVQLEIGDTATPFENRMYSQELAMCQRYYYKIISGGAGYSRFQSGFVANTTTTSGITYFPVIMRTRPTALETSGTTGDYAVVYAATAALCTSIPVYSITTSNSQGVVAFTTNAVLTVGHGIMNSSSSGNANAYLAWSAEL